MSNLHKPILRSMGYRANELSWQTSDGKLQWQVIAKGPGQHTILVWASSQAEAWNLAVESARKPQPT